MLDPEQNEIEDEILVWLEAKFGRPEVVFHRRINDGAWLSMTPASRAFPHAPRGPSFPAYIQNDILIYIQTGSLVMDGWHILFAEQYGRSSIGGIELGEDAHYELWIGRTDPGPEPIKAVDDVFAMTAIRSLTAEIGPRLNAVLHALSQGPVEANPEFFRMLGRLNRAAASMGEAEDPFDVR